MKIIIFFGILQLSFIQAFAQDHGHDRNHNGYNHFNGRTDRDHHYNRNFSDRRDNGRHDVFIHHDGFRHYDNHIIFHNDYAYHNAYRPLFHSVYPHAYNRAYIPLINFSFGSSYPYGYAYQSDFDRVLIAINNQPTDESRLIVAKQAIQDRSLTSDEVLTIMKSLEYDANKLEFAEMAYDHVVDKNNFYSVNSAFAYTSSVNDLNSFLESQYGTR